MKFENICDLIVLSTTLSSLITLTIHFSFYDLKYYDYLQRGLNLGDYALLFAWWNLLFHYAQTFPLVSNIIHYAISSSKILIFLILLLALPLLFSYGLFFHARFDDMYNKLTLKKSLYISQAVRYLQKSKTKLNVFLQLREYVLYENIKELPSKIAHFMAQSESFSNATQCPRTDLSKRFLPKQMTTTG